MGLRGDKNKFLVAMGPAIQPPYRREMKRQVDRVTTLIHRDEQIEKLTEQIYIQDPLLCDTARWVAHSQAGSDCLRKIHKGIIRLKRRISLIPPHSSPKCHCQYNVQRSSSSSSNIIININWGVLLRSSYRS